MTAPLLPRLGHADRAVAATLLLAAGAWALVVVGFATGKETLVTHDAVIEGDLPVTLRLLGFVAAWPVMAAAMMLPTAVPVVGEFGRLARARPRPGAAVTAFVAAYLVVWVGFGALALVGDTGLHKVVHAWPWLEERPSAITGGVLLLAGACQFLPMPRRCLAACRDPAGLLTRIGGLQAGAWRVGIWHGVACLGATGALMLLMFAVGVHSLAWTVLLTGVLVAEKTLPGGTRLASLVGVALLVAGAVVTLGLP